MQRLAYRLWPNAGNAYFNGLRGILGPSRWPISVAQARAKLLMTETEIISKTVKAQTWPFLTVFKVRESVDASPPAMPSPHSREHSTEITPPPPLQGTFIPRTDDLLRSPERCDARWGLSKSSMVKIYLFHPVSVGHLS